MWRKQILNFISISLFITKILEFKFFRFFWQCTFIYSYRLTIFVQCIAEIRSYSDLLKFLSYLVWFSRYKLLYLFIFNSVWQQCNDLSWKISICKLWNVLKRVIYVIKRSSFLLLKAEIQAHPSSYFLQCTGINLYFLILFQNCRVL